METVVCPLCSGKSATPLYGRESLQVVLCETCALAYLNPRMSEEELNAFYEREYQATRQGVHDIDAAVARLKEPGRYEKKLKRAETFLPFLSSESKVLEIGAGYGTLLAAVRERSQAAVAGVEPSTLGVAVAKKLYDIDVQGGTFDACYPALVCNEMRFDFVILVHVLEHLRDLHTSLAHIKTLMQPKGVLYIAVPNILAPDDAPDRFFHKEHLTYFSPQTLTRLLHQAGFSITAFHERPTEMIVFATLEVSDREVWKDYRGNVAEVKTALQVHTKKYALLRTVRTLIGGMMPRTMNRLVRMYGARIARMFGIIRQ